MNRRIPVWAMGAAIVVGVIVAGASGQPVERRVVRGGPGGAAAAGGLPRVETAPPLSRERLVRYAGALDLDREQTAAAETLYAGYVEATTRQQKKMREDLRRASEDAQDGDRGAFEKGLPAMMKSSGAEMGRLRDQFLADLKSLLRPEQAGNWDRLERLRRRDNFLSRGSLSGSNVDLLAIIDALKLGEKDRAGLKGTLGEYEVDLDRPLKEREAAASVGVDANGSRSFDADSMKKNLEEQRTIDAKVQEVNRRYARTLAEMVPAEQRAVLDELVKQQAFKRVYKEASAARKARAAQGLDGLSETQRTAMTKALADYDKGIKGANDRWAAAVDRAEKAGQTPFAPFAAITGEKPDADLAAARQARRDLDNTLRKAVDTTLTPEQIAALQPATPDGAGMGMGNKMVIATAGGPGGLGGPTVFSSDDMDDEDGAGMMGGPGGGVVIMKHDVTSSGDGNDHHEVSITTTAPPTGDKPAPKKR